MSFYTLSSLLASITLIALGIFLFIAGKARLEIRICSYMCFGVVFWQIGSFGFSTATSKEMAFYWWQFAHIGAMIVPPIFLHFTCLYLNIRKNRMTILAYIFSLIFIVINFCCGRYFIGDLRLTPDHFYWLDWFRYHNPLLIFYYLVFYVILLSYSFFLLLRAFKQSQGIKRKQLLYLIIGLAIGWSGPVGIIISYFRINLYTFTNVLMGLFSVIMAYAIVRHQLMDIEVIIRKTLVFAGLFATALAIFILPTLIIQEFVTSHMGLGGRIASLSISAFLIVLILEPLKNFLIRITDEFLFQKKYDYQQVLKAFIDEVITVLDLKKIVKGTLDLLEETIHPESVSILLISEDTNELTVFDTDSKNKIILQRKSDIFSYLASTKTILIVEGNNQPNVPEAIKEEARSLAIHVAVPLYVQDDIIGVMVLGKKKSDEYYSQEDLSILTDLARTEAIAVKNAQFYEKSRREIADRSERKGVKNVAIGASHQMYNALANVQTIAELMHEEITDLNSKKVRLDQAHKLINFLKNELEILLTESKRGRNMLRSILDRAKAREAFKEVNLYATVKRAVDRSAQSKIKEMATEGIPVPQVLYNIPSDFSNIVGNEHLIEEIFVNLVNNAFDAISDRYHHLKTDSSFKSKISISAEDKGEKIKIEVRDNGIGIKNEVKEKLFAAYFTTKATSQKGFGAGLYSIREWIEQHNGNITFKSEYGRGTMFSVEFPKTQEGFYGTEITNSRG